jgi:hypothetical protein
MRYISFMSRTITFCLHFILIGFLLSCSKSQTSYIKTGREYDEPRKNVVDTTNTFYPNDPFYLKLFYNKPFNTDSLELILWQVSANKGETLYYSKMFQVNPETGHFVIRGKSNRDPYQARSFFSTGRKQGQAGLYRIEFKINNQSILSKDIEYAIRN